MNAIEVGPDLFPCIEAGEGRPLLLLHGAPGDARTWRRHVAALGTPSQRAIAYTQRWFGTGEWPADGPSFGVKTHAKDLIAVIEALGAGPAAVVAWSYSGHVALYAALRRPDLFTRMLVYEPGVPTWLRGRGDIQLHGEIQSIEFGPIFKASARGEMEEALRLLIDLSGGSGWFEAQPEEVRTVHLDNAHVIPRLALQHRPPRISCRDLADITVPVTIAWGEATSLLFSLPSEAAARCIGGDRHVNVPGAGHLWPEQDVKGFVRLVERWQAG